MSSLNAHSKHSSPFPQSCVALVPSNLGHESSKFKSTLDLNKKNDVTFTTLANLITALFNDLRNLYVTGDTPIDIKMRSRISRVQEIVNSQDEISNLLVKKQNHAANNSTFKKQSDTILK